MHSIWLVLVLSVLSSSVCAGTLGDLTYKIADGQVTITDCYFEAEGELVIPAEIEGLPVTSIGRSVWGGAFSGCESLTSITIPDSVTSIGDEAFRYCTSLTSITIPEGVKSIGDGAFQSCSRLSRITIPDSVTSIGDWAFYDCRRLTSITIPKAFHSQTEAERLEIRHLWPDGFFLPSSVTRTPELSIRLPLQLIVTGDQNANAVIEATDSVSGPWAEWRTVVIGEEGTTEVDLDEGAEKRFYRVGD